MAICGPASERASYEHRLSRHAWAESISKDGDMSNDKLKEAIRRVRSYRHGNSTFMIDGAEPTTNACIDMVLGAAESTLLAPMMPPKPTPEMIEVMLQARTTLPTTPHETMERIYEHLYRHLTKPKTKMVASERLRESVDAFRANGCKEFYDLANMARALADFADEQLERKA